MDNGLIITRDIAVRAIQHKLPNEPIFGISKLILIGFQEIYWVEYIPRLVLWNLEFDNQESLILFRISYS